jgi:Zn-dependent M16 (insulinase) family peptidase
MKCSGESLSYRKAIISFRIFFLFKAVRGSEYVPASEPDFKIRLPEKRNIYINNIENFIGNMLVRRALYEMQFDETEKAKKYIDKIKSDLPNYIIPAGISEAIGN